MNVIARLEYELAYYDSAVHRFNHCITRTPSTTTKFRHSWLETPNIFCHVPLRIAFLNRFYDHFYCFSRQFLCWCHLSFWLDITNYLLPSTKWTSCMFAWGSIYSFIWNSLYLEWSTRRTKESLCCETLLTKNNKETASIHDAFTQMEINI